jgi:transposase-like protein
MPRIRRSFSPQFKAKVVVDLLTGAVSQAELARRHGLKPDLVARWKADAIGRLPDLFAGDDQAQQHQARIAELEQIIGRQTVELEELKKASRLLTGTPARSGTSP